jgi:hypothetical protein
MKGVRKPLELGDQVVDLRVHVARRHRTQLRNHLELSPRRGGDLVAIRGTPRDLDTPFQYRPARSQETSVDFRPVRSHLLRPELRLERLHPLDKIVDLQVLHWLRGDPEVAQHRDLRLDLHLQHRFVGQPDARLQAPGPQSPACLDDQLVNIARRIRETPHAGDDYSGPEGSQRCPTDPPSSGSATSHASLRCAKATGVELRIVVRDGQAVFEPIDGKLSESGEQQRPVDEELKGYL